MEIGNDVIVKETGEQGKIVILEGIPYRVAYVEIIPGASGSYIYISMASIDGDVETLALNRYKITELKKIESIIDPRSSVDLEQRASNP